MTTVSSYEPYFSLKISFGPYTDDNAKLHTPIPEDQDQLASDLRKSATLSEYLRTIRRRCLYLLCSSISEKLLPFLGEPTPRSRWNETVADRGNPPYPGSNTGWASANHAFFRTLYRISRRYRDNCSRLS